MNDRARGEEDGGDRKRGGGSQQTTKIKATVSLISSSQKQPHLPHSTRHTDHPRDNLGGANVVCEHLKCRPLGLSWSLAT